MAGASGVLEPGLRAAKRSRESGFAMIAFLSLITLLGSWLIASALNRTGAELKNERDRRTMEALKKAKAALIGYAASEQWQVYKSNATKFQPGALPCPDRDNDGDSEGLCSSELTRIGRLPWLTVGTDDLRDASGERLWYALSSNFRKLDGTTVINSDTRGQLTVTGATPASNVVAIVFAPGEPLAGQDRDPTNSTLLNSPSSYLEGFNATYDSFASSTQTSETFNDRLIIITEDELMEAVEPVVAALIERDVKPFLATYFASWGRYPFPARFDNPDPGTMGSGTTRPQSAYAGYYDPNEPLLTFGLLPITNAATYTWTSQGVASATNATNPLQFNSSCVDTASAYTCTFTMPGTLIPSTVFTMERDFTNPGTSFATLPSLASITVTLNGESSGLVSSQLSGSITSATTGRITYQGTYIGGSCVGCVLIITIPNVGVSSVTSTNWQNSAAYWFIANEWYRHTFYALAPGFLPGGSGSCSVVAPATCLTVNNLSPAYPTANDKRVVLVLAGRTLNGASRPSANIADYLEGENPTYADSLYEHRSGVTRAVLPPSTSYAINDRVVVIAP